MFGLTPAGSGFPPQAPDDFPNYIQLQSNGTDLGAPNVDTIDFADGLVATRGTGENANKVTVIAGTNLSGGAVAAADELVASLVGSASGAFNGAAFSNWTGTVLHTSADAEWNEATNAIDVLQTGLYEVSIQARVTPNGGTWPSAQGDFVQYGSEVSPSVGSVAGGAQSQYGITVSAAAGWQATGLFVQFSDRYFVNVPSLPSSITPAVYADAYTSETEVADFTAVVAVRRVGAAAP